MVTVWAMTLLTCILGASAAPADHSEKLQVHTLRDNQQLSTVLLQLKHSPHLSTQVHQLLGSADSHTRTLLEDLLRILHLLGYTDQEIAQVCIRKT